MFVQVSFSDQSTIEAVPWKDLGCDIVLECTGVFLTSDKVMPYINAGVKKVVCSFPLKEPSILNIVVGVNDDKLTADMPICTAASCTTNCLAPVVKVRFSFSCRRRLPKRVTCRSFTRTSRSSEA